MIFDYRLLGNEDRKYLEKRMREIFPCEEPLQVLLQGCEMVCNHTDSAFPDNIDIYFMGNLIMRITGASSIQAMGIYEGTKRNMGNCLELNKQIKEVNND